MRQQRSSYRGRALAEAEVQDFEYHDLRHSAGIQALARASQPRRYSTLLGHNEIKTALRYTRSDDEDRSYGSPGEVTIATQTANGRRKERVITNLRQSGAPAPKAPALPDSAAPHPKVERVLIVRDTPQ
jgi:hypothetical protein